MARLTNPFRTRVASPASTVSDSLIVLEGSPATSSQASTGPTSATSSISTRLPPSKQPLNPSGRHSSRLGATIDATSRETTPRASPRVKRKQSTLRTVSGDTLVEGLTEGLTKSEKDLIDDGFKALDKALDLQWTVDGTSKVAVERKIELSRRQSSRIGKIAKSVTTTVLGKRGLEALETGKSKLQRMTSTKLNKRASLRPRPSQHDETIVLQENKTVIQQSENEPLRKKLRGSIMSAPSLLGPLKGKTGNSEKPTTEGLLKRKAEDEPLPEQPKPKKRWLSQGLYVGQDQDFKAYLTGFQNRNKKATPVKDHSFKDNKSLPLPMFAGESLLKTGRPFRLPFDIYSPLPKGAPKPDHYAKIQQNRFVGDASSEWKKQASLPASYCICTEEDGCDEHCLNRIMGYECDDTNCAVGRLCGNRQFADLKDRLKTTRKFDVGVEVFKTDHKGFGVRASRSFNPGQIILEYAGEIITQDECDRRVRNEYKNAECFYLMEFAQNMILDATRGSVARFVNHSCAPNSAMEKWTVLGKPRMALFAGPRGIMTGEELTYDYNFDPFSLKKVQKCYCGADKCRGTLGPRRKA